MGHNCTNFLNHLLKFKFHWEFWIFLAILLLNCSWTLKFNVTYVRKGILHHNKMKPHSLRDVRQPSFISCSYYMYFVGQQRSPINRGSSRLPLQRCSLRCQRGGERAVHSHINSEMPWPGRNRHHCLLLPIGQKEFPGPIQKRGTGWSTLPGPGKDWNYVRVFQWCIPRYNFLEVESFSF